MLILAAKVQQKSHICKYFRHFLPKTAYFLRFSAFFFAKSAIIFAKTGFFVLFIRFLCHFCCYVKGERLGNVKTHG
jgi:hypothetical protein